MMRPMLLYMQENKELELSKNAAIAAGKPEWNGEGLPPVGCECEFKANDGGWGIGTVLCVGKSRIFWLCHEDGDEYTSEVNPQEFRPIRSEADKKRDEVTQSILDILNDYDFELVHIRSDQKRIATDIVERITSGIVPHIRID